MTVTEYTQNEENNNRKSRRRRRWRAITGFHSKHLLKRCRYGCTSRWSTGTEDRGVMTASGYPRCEGVKFAWTEKRSVTTRHTGASAGMHISALENTPFYKSGLHPSTVRNTPFYSRDYTLPLSGIHLSAAEAYLSLSAFSLCMFSSTTLKLSYVLNLAILSSPDQKERAGGGRGRQRESIL